MSLKNTKFILLILFVLFTQNLQAQSDAEKQGAEIYAKYEKAIGGKEAHARIKIVEKIVEIQTPGGIEKETVVEEKGSNRFVKISEGGAKGKSEMGCDGKNVWVRSALRSGNIMTVGKSEEKPSTYQRIPNEVIDGKEYLVLQSEGTKQYFEAKSYLLYKREIKTVVSGFDFQKDSIYEDYRKVGEILEPFSETTTDSKGKSVRKVLSIRHNFEFSPSIFEYQPADKKTTTETKTSNETQKNGSLPTSNSSDEEKKRLFAKNAIYQDENGNVITEKEYKDKIEGSNYGHGPFQIADGKFIMKLKKNGVNVAAQDFTGTLLDGSTIQLSQLKGKVVVLNFWFTACAPCIKEMPELNALVKQYKGNQDVKFFSITYNTKEEVAEFFTKRTFDYQPIINAKDIIELYQNPAFPTHIVIDKEGVIRLTQLGFSPKIKERLLEVIDKALIKEKAG